MIENQPGVGTHSLRDEIAMRVLIAERARRAICSAAALTSQYGGMTAVDIPLDLECAGAYRVADEMLKARGDTPCAQPNTIEVRLDNAGIGIQPDKRPMSRDVVEEL